MDMYSGGKTGQMIFRVELPGKKKRGIPQKRVMDVRDRVRWRQMIDCGEP